ncbi:hypothetical protein SEA_MISCHIEF19_19 [Streptomyces phage Mischief19]|nr:hypothetical protein SEA_MISCHIEF19_19 [Streptomyces phage Mischief19]
MPLPCNGCSQPGCFTFQGDPSRPVVSMTVPNPSGGGTSLRWYDLDGNDVAPGDVVPCDAPDNHAPITALTFQPVFFGDGPDGLAENLCAFSTPPTAPGNWTLVAGGCYDPPSPGGASNLGWAVPPMRSLTFEYGNPPRASGGAYLIVSSPDLGGTVTWPTTGQLDPGQTTLSNVTPNGRRVLLSYLSGPLGSAPSGSVQTVSGNQVWFHRNSTSGTAPPIRVRLDFLNS